MKKKITFLLLMIFATANIYSQNYTISFDASGTTNTLDSVRIINLTHPDTAIWHNGDIFQLQLNNAINEIETNKENLHIFPNPMQGQAEIMFSVKQSGFASIKIYEVTGKEIIHSDENLSQGNHQFQLSGLKQGAYFINIRGNGYFYRSKLISYNSFSNDINLKYNGVIQETNTNIYKTTNSSINFNFVSGDMLQFTGYAANLTDVFTYSPTSDITVTFNFIASIPSVTTNVATSITTNSAISGGNVTSDGGEIVTERGICYSTTTNPTIADNIVAAGSGTGLFTANLAGLIPSTTYYIRAYATNSVGTAYGNQNTITTTSTGILATLTTLNVSNITSTSAISGGLISSDGGNLVTLRGICYSTNANPTISDSVVQSGIGLGSFNSTINNLISNNTYYVRAFAINSAGIAYGNQQIFSTVTSSQMPVLIINSIDEIKSNSVKITSGIILNGNTSNKSRGICYNLTGNPTKANDTLNIGSGWGIYSTTISNLTPDTKYYVRAYATDSLGTTYSNQFSFNTLKANFSSSTANIVFDIDGNGYDTVVIGSQVWLKQNLKTTHYLNGNSITNITNNTQWDNLTSEAYSWYNNDSVINKNTYGGLYNFYAVSDPRKLCPIGWHVPSQEDFFILGNYLGNDGGKLKETGTNHWLSPNTGATNESEYTALAGGMRGSYGGFVELKEYANFWASTSVDSLKGKSFYLSCNSSNINNYSLNKKRGNSIRCIKDNGLMNTKPIILIKSINNIEATSSVVNISIAFKGIDSLYSFGVCYSLSPNPSIYDNISIVTTSVTSIPFYTAVNLINLNANSTYYVRTFATNMYGTVYGNEIRFATTPQLITPITTNATLITDVSANSGCSISNSLGLSVYSVGVCYSTSVNPTLQNTYISNGNSIGTFSYSLTGLTPNTTYYVRAYIKTNAGTYYGNQISFTTLMSIPRLTTTSVSSITTISALASGNITSDCGSTITARGICYSLGFNPTTSDNVINCGSGTGTISANLTGLAPNTTYNVRAFAINNIGTAYGNNISFTTTPITTFPVYDIDGNGYDTIRIGVQTWLKQNLKTTRLNDNTYIPSVNDTNLWGNSNTARCYANSDSSAYNAIYGALYNWLAVNTGKLCPLGWQVPSAEEWTSLSNYLGGDYIAGPKLKETGTMHWNSPNIDATNSSNFTALPGGYRNVNTSYNTVKTYGMWWSSTIASQGMPFFRSLASNSNNFSSYSTDLRLGYSVRCIKTARPILSTISVSGISTNTAVSGGNIINDNGSAITTKGICWDTLPNPIITANNYTYNGTGTSSYSSNLTGLLANKTYYIRAYATNSSGIGYGNEISFTTLPIYKVYDIEGNAYDTVHIGTQVWMKQNLKTTHYNNGVSITYPGTNNAAWQNNTSGAYAWYDNNEVSYKNTYGALYNWYAVNTGNLCPTGWHAPTAAEWAVLVNYLGGSTIAGGKLKATTLWNSPNNGASNSTGFTALPGGCRSNDGSFSMYDNITYTGYFWSSTESNSTDAIERYMYYNSNYTYLSNNNKAYGFSVRCLLGMNAQVSLPIISTTITSAITDTNAASGGNISSDGGTPVTARGVCWSTSPSPTIALSTKTINGTGSGSFTSNITGLLPNTTYYVRAYATNSVGTAYGNAIGFTTTFSSSPVVFDFDGNIYDTIHIGSQIWMKQNLKTTHYNNGTAIPNATDNGSWAIATAGAYCDYNNSPANGATYGRLYNWHVVNTGNLCPTGWHVPSDAEWLTLMLNLGSPNNAGGPLKSTTLWNAPNTGATNSSGFTALPGGYRSTSGGYYNIGNYGFWWTSTLVPYVTANYWELVYDGNHTIGHYTEQERGFSVRCLYNNSAQVNLPTVTTTLTSFIDTNATFGGNISSDGGTPVTARGVCWSTSPGPTITLITKTTNGTGTGSFTSNITGLVPNTTYYVRAYATNNVGTAYGNEVFFTTSTALVTMVTDYDGNIYDTIHIGTQVWMKQNLKTTHYKNGTSINYPGTNNTTWQNNTSGAYAWYDNDEATYKNTYGALYNWYAVNTGNLCPTGWHVPTDAEWTTLTNYLGGDSIAGNKLKATILWYISSGASNSSGFTALPGGYRSDDGTYNSIATYAYWWSSSVYSNPNYAWSRFINSSFSKVFRSNSIKSAGFSVRCLKD